MEDDVYLICKMLDRAGICYVMRTQPASDVSKLTRETTVIVDDGRLNQDVIFNFDGTKLESIATSE